jgi:hypothetical protein
MANPLKHYKSTFFGIILLAIATVYTFAPYRFPEASYEPSYWLTGGLYLASGVFILFEPNEAQKALKLLLNKWINK